MWSEGDRESFFIEGKDGSFRARSLLVDMEPKVLTEIVNTRKEFKYSRQNVISASSGSANNWG